MAAPTFAYLAEHQVHLASDDGTSEAVESRFIEDVRRREASIERKTGWKTRGSGARFMGAAALWDGNDGRRQPVVFSCVSAGRREGEILYALTTGVVSGIFAFDVTTREETRLSHDAEGAAVDLATSDEHTVLAFVRRQKNGSCNVAVMRDDGGESALVTDGDTIDGAPSWVPAGRVATEGRHQLVFHSAGIGRDGAGAMAGFGPHEIQLLDAEHGTLRTLVSDPSCDYLAPRMTREGTLFALKRPYRAGPPLPDAAALMKDGLLAPFRLVYAGFRYLDFFSMKYAGKPLTTSGNTKGRNVDARRLLERQNVAAVGEGESEEDAMRAPGDWVLVRRLPSGEETTLASAVAAYDVARDGSLLVTDGVSVSRLRPDGGGRTKVLAARLVTSLVSL